MSSFMVDLWESVFTPGPTPVLLQATNYTFASLQLLLLVLLLSTYSIHFVVLSVLSGGLWWAINWFAKELEAAKARGEITDNTKDDEGEDTEVDYAGKTNDADTKTAEAKKTTRRRKGGDDESTEDEWEKVAKDQE